MKYLLFTGFSPPIRNDGSVWLHFRCAHMQDASAQRPHMHMKCMGNIKQFTYFHAEVCAMRKKKKRRRIMLDAICSSYVAVYSQCALFYVRLQPVECMFRVALLLFLRPAIVIALPQPHHSPLSLIPYFIAPVREH